MTALRSTRLSWGLHLAALLFVDLILLAYTRQVETLDVRLAYPAREVADLLERIGDAGRATYSRFALIDLLLLIPLYGTLLVRLGRRYGARYVSLLVLAVCALDAIETGGVLVLLTAYPEPMPALASAISLATPLKWASFAGALAWIAIAAARRRARRHVDR